MLSRGIIFLRLSIAAASLVLVVSACAWRVFHVKHYNVVVSAQYSGYHKYIGPNERALARHI
jgi:hypothetical protein